MYLDAQEVASKLKAAGITPDNLILVWHCSEYDLTLLRSSLDSEGYSGILPPDGNCIPMIQLFRSNLKGGLTVPGQKRQFPLNLPMLFSLFFPTPDLVGLNHRALEDCLQTMLLVFAYDELIRRPEARLDSQIEKLGRGTQRSIVDSCRNLAAKL
jgi:hypothetical protein